jgi:hypothetical protein
MKLCTICLHCMFEALSPSLQPKNMHHHSGDSIITVDLQGIHAEKEFSMEGGVNYWTLNPACRCCAHKRH